MFRLTRNLAGFPANPVGYPLADNTNFKKGMLVTITEGVVTPCDNESTSALGVMAEDMAAGEGLTGQIYDNPLNIYKGAYDGNPGIGKAIGLKEDEPETLDADAVSGILVIVGFDDESADFIIKTHIFK